MEFDVYQVVSMLTGSGAVTAAFGYVLSRLKAAERRNRALESGVQALLRDRMIQAYNYWSDRGSVPHVARSNFENMWEQYHNLGVNGVMDDLHGKFLELPIENEKE